jgi:hypothetical protein
MFLLGRFLVILLALNSCITTHKQSNLVTQENINFNDWERPSCDVMVEDNRRSWQDLAEYTKVPVSILKRYNKSKLLKVGEKIHVPAKLLYKVKDGETSIGIAAKFGMTFSELITLNYLDPPFELKNGQELKVVQISAHLFTHKSTNAKKLIFAWPVQGKVVINFGAEKNGALNDGIRIFVATKAEVRAAAAGTVVYVGNEIGSYGNVVIIQHKDEYLSSYGSLEEISVAKGDIVKLGQNIGIINNAKLYFGLRKGATPVDPLKYFTKTKKNRKN